MPFKRKKGCDTTPEHPFRVLKRQFGYTKVRYRGLFKNEQHLFSQFALVDLYLARSPNRSCRLSARGKVYRPREKSTP